MYFQSVEFRKERTKADNFEKYNEWPRSRHKLCYSSLPRVAHILPQRDILNTIDGQHSLLHLIHSSPCFRQFLPTKLNVLRSVDPLLVEPTRRTILPIGKKKSSGGKAG